MGVIVGWLIPRSRPSPEATIAVEPATESAAASIDETSVVEGPTAEVEVPRIGMEDVVTELERRYEGRRADEEKERARRRREESPP